MAETDYNCVEECKTLAKAISEQAQTNAGYKVAAELTGLELAREEAAASDRIAALYTPTILKIKIHTDPLVIEACGPLGPSPDGVNVRIFRLISSLDMSTP